MYQKIGKIMQMIINTLFSSLSSSFIGSLVLSLVFTILNKAPYSISSIIPIFLVSGIGLVITSLVLVLPLSWKFELPQGGLMCFFIGSFGGAIFYFLINGLIHLFTVKNSIISFLTDGIFVFPVLIGFLYGGIYAVSLRLIIGSDK
tara:strand:+ start:601 stop:1038 length:438 start_codon:yes stop_codon:yes gene_type:complete